MQDPPCPDVPLPSDRDRTAIKDVTTKYAKSGEENGSQLFRDPQTGKETFRTRDAAGSALAGEDGEFQHKIPKKDLPNLVMLSHTHLTPLSTGDHISDMQRKGGQNAPSEADQKSMNQVGRAVQTIGPNVTTTLYRMNNVDHLHIDFGNPALVPDLKGQHIMVDPIGGQ